MELVILNRCLVLDLPKDYHLVKAHVAGGVACEL